MTLRFTKSIFRHLLSQLSGGPLRVTLNHSVTETTALCAPTSAAAGRRCLRCVRHCLRRGWAATAFSQLPRLGPLAAGATYGFPNPFGKQYYGLELRTELLSVYAELETTDAALPQLGLALLTALLLQSYGLLLTASRPVTAIFAFLAYLLALLPAFFALDGDYLGAIHLLVYPGAILIFFAFASLTTDQRGSWTAGSAGAPAGGTAAGLALAALLLTLWGSALAPALSGSRLPVRTMPPMPALDKVVADNLMPPVLENTTGLVALGGELFGQRLLSLQLLGLLLLLAFLVSLRLLAESFRRPAPALLPRLGAAALGGGLVYATFRTPFGGDGYLPLALLLLALAFGALAARRYAFLQCFLLLEGAGLALNLLFTAAAASGESLEGETLVVVAVAVAAAETAVGLGAFLALSQGSGSAAAPGFSGPAAATPAPQAAPAFPKRAAAAAAHAAIPQAVHDSILRSLFCDLGPALAHPRPPKPTLAEESAEGPEAEPLFYDHSAGSTGRPVGEGDSGGVAPRSRANFAKGEGSLAFRAASQRCSGHGSCRRGWGERRSSFGQPATGAPEPGKGFPPAKGGGPLCGGTPSPVLRRTLRRHFGRPAGGDGSQTVTGAALRERGLTQGNPGSPRRGLALAGVHRHRAALPLGWGDPAKPAAPGRESTTGAGGAPGEPRGPRAPPFSGGRNRSLCLGRGCQPTAGWGGWGASAGGRNWGGCGDSGVPSPYQFFSPFN